MPHPAFCLPCRRPSAACTAGQTTGGHSKVTPYAHAINASAAERQSRACGVLHSVILLWMVIMFHSSGPDFVRFYNPYGHVVYLLWDGGGYGAACGLRLHIDMNSRSIPLLRQPHAYAYDAWNT